MQLNVMNIPAGECTPMICDVNSAENPYGKIYSRDLWCQFSEPLREIARRKADFFDSSSEMYYFLKGFGYFPRQDLKKSACCGQY